MTEDFKCLNAALEWASNGFSVYPTPKGKKSAFRGSHSFKDATDDEEQVFEMFKNHPGADLSLRLDGLICLDIDVNHNNNVNGFVSLKNAGIKLPKNTRVEATPAGGMHLLFEYKGKHFNHLDLIPGVEARGDQIKLYPSLNYKLLTDDPILRTPKWLVDLIEQARKPKYEPNSYYRPGQITYTAKIINEIFSGTQIGSRNTWIAQKIGLLLGQGVKASYCHALMWFITETVLQDHQRPISRNEFDTTFKSIYQKELRKLKALGGDSN